eukprot:Gb_24577 [translate_table: standard]
MPRFLRHMISLPQSVLLGVTSHPPDHTSGLHGDHGTPQHMDFKTLGFNPIMTAELRCLAVLNLDYGFGHKVQRHNLDQYTTVLVLEGMKIVESTEEDLQSKIVSITRWITKSLRVTLGDQSTYEAKVIGYDQDKDVAVLRIDAPKDKLKPIPVGSSTDLLVGQKVYAIGNPVSVLFCTFPSIFCPLDL